MTTEHAPAVDAFDLRGADQEPAQVCDFRRAYLHFDLDFQKQPPTTVTVQQPFTLNHVRIPLECRCDIDGVAYVLGAACKTESVNVDRDIWTLPNADFHPVVSRERFMIIKHWDHRERRVPNTLVGGQQPRRQSGLAAEAWAAHRIDTPVARGRRLRDADEAWEAVNANQFTVSRTTYVSREGRKVVLEYPVKTINVSNRDQFCQSDTGPVLIPLQGADGQNVIDTLHLAYIAQRGSSWAEFIANVPTPITDGVSVDHYSQVVRVEATNAWYVLD